MAMMKKTGNSGKSPMSMKAAMKKVEASAEDRARDKKLNLKEGSKADLKADKAQAKRMMGGASGKCKCGMTLKGGKCPGCGNSPARCSCAK